MNDNYMVGSVDWQRKWVRSVVCSNQGVTLHQAMWPSEEAADHLVAFFHDQRERYGMPLVVTGRSRAPWPNGLLEQFWRSGFPVELYDGAPLGSMVRLEQTYREQVDFRTASLLAAIHVARKQPKGVGDVRDFVLRWCMEQARQRHDELALELQSGQPPEWSEKGIEAGPWSRLQPAVYSDLVCLRMLPLVPVQTNSHQEAWQR